MSSPAVRGDAGTRHPTARRARALRLAGRAALAVAAGVAGALAFPRVGIWPLACLSVAGLSVAVDGVRCRRGAWLGGLYGLAFFGPLLHWTGTYVGAFPWLLLTAAESVFLVGLGALLPLVQRLRLAPLWVACAWVLQEAARDRLPFGGFPWGRLAFSQQDSPLRWVVLLGGAPLLSFAVALTGAGLLPVARAVAIRAGRPDRTDRAGVPDRTARPRLLRPAGAGLALVLAVPLLAQWASVLRAPTAPVAGHALRVALVQGSVPDRGLDSFDRAEQVLDNHVHQTLRLAREVTAGTVPRPDLVVWPENASDVDPFRNADAAAKIGTAVHAVGVPVLVGAILQGPGPDHRRNAGILWSPATGPGAVYLKRHPVPFAEYLPWRSLADRVSSAARLVTQDMVAGHGDGLVRGGPVPFGDVICFEVAYDDLVRSSVLAGAQLLVVQTNNATFGRTSETYQQLAMSRLRAIETGRSVLQVSTTGESAVIDADGTVVAASGALFRPALLSATVRTSTARTLAVRLGPRPEQALSLLAVIAALAALLRARRRRSTAPGRTGAPDAPGRPIPTGVATDAPTPTGGHPSGPAEEEVIGS